MTGTGTRVAGMFFDSFDIDLVGSVLAAVTVTLPALAALA